MSEPIKCPDCGAGFSSNAHGRLGWVRSQCDRRWHPVHGWAPCESTACLRRQLAAAEKLCEIYFTIAAEALGQDEVRNRRDA